MTLPDAPSVTLHPRWLRVHFGPSRGHADYHLRWLRHLCDRDRHPVTGERTVDPSDLPDVLQARDARIDGDALRVVWSHDGRESAYPLAWLMEHAYARDREDVPPPPSDLARITLAAPRDALASIAPDVLARVRAEGAAVVRRHPDEDRDPSAQTESLLDAFGAQGLRVIGTHFGRIEDLRTDNTTNANTDQLGYTDAAIDVHTDQPFLDDPPRYQLLQSIRAADAGGENAVVDALAAARHLRAVDLPAYEVLTRVPVRFHRKQKAFERVVDAPILRDVDDAARFMVRYSYFTTAPFQRPFAEMDAWYRAYEAFARIVRDPRHQYRFALRPGDFVLYDNHRMLHARTAFRGPRWVRGVYFDP